jgi:hypothetical protein
MRWWRVTIRAKLYVAILLTMIGPVIQALPARWLAIGWAC